MTAPPPAPWPPHDHDAAADVAALSIVVRHTVELASGLRAKGRRIDVTGLDQTVGLLCAKALDLPPGQGRAARPGLIAVLAEIVALDAAFRDGDA